MVSRIIIFTLFIILCSPLDFIIKSKAGYFRSDILNVGKSLSINSKWNIRYLITFYDRTFSKSRVAHDTNSVSSFNVDLSSCGGVHPNPGPNTSTSRTVSKLNCCQDAPEHCRERVQ